MRLPTLLALTLALTSCDALVICTGDKVKVGGLCVDDAGPGDGGAVSDTGGTVPGPGLSPEPGPEPVVDVGEPDAGTEPCSQSPFELGCPCEVDEDCETGICNRTLDGGPSAGGGFLGVCTT